MAETAIEGDLLSVADAAPLTRRYWLTYGLLNIQIICEVFDFILVGFLVAVVAPLWKLNFGESTIILLGTGLGAIFGSLGFGRISDRYGRRAAILCGTVIYCCAAGAIALIPDGAWMLFALLRFLVGVGYGAAGSSQWALVVESTPSAKRTLMGSLLGIPASLGVVFASMIVAGLLPALGWRGAAALGFLPIFVGLALVWCAPESARWLVANGRIEDARKSVAKMLGRPVESLPMPAVLPPRAPPLPFSEVFKHPREFWLISLVQMGMGTALSGVLLWGPTVFGQMLRLKPEAAAAAFTLVTLSGLAGRGAFALAPQVWGRVPCGILAGYAGAVLLGLAAIYHGSFVGMIPLFLVFVVAGQFFYDGIYSNLNPYSAELFPVRLAAVGVGVASSAGGVGKIAGPLILGLLAGTGNLVTPHATEQAVGPGFLFLAGCSLVGGLAFTFLGVETHKRALTVS